jgi:acyl-CoA synthetase (AMP-forming)/AMP-acid ligase II
MAAHSTPLVVTDDAPGQVLRALAGPRGDRTAVAPAVVLPARWTTAQQARAVAAAADAPPGTWLVTITSGSSGRERAVARSLASWAVSVDWWARTAGIGTGTRLLVPGPLSSSLFLHAAWHGRHVGAAVRTAPLTADGEWEVAIGTPAMLAEVLRRTSTSTALAGRRFVVAGAALPASLAEEARRQHLALVAYYGAAELSFVATGTPAPLTVAPDVQVVSRSGVLWVQTPGRCLAVLGTPGTYRTDGAGWATVGDLGDLADDGTLQVRGRGDLAVTTGGVTVLVEDVEAALRHAPGVIDVAVSERPHQRLGAVLTAVVVLDPAASLKEVRAWSRRLLPPAQRPRAWVCQPALPWLATGKLDRAAVRLLAAG